MYRDTFAPCCRQSLPTRPSPDIVRMGDSIFDIHRSQKEGAIARCYRRTGIVLKSIGGTRWPEKNPSTVFVISFDMLERMAR